MPIHQQHSIRYLITLAALVGMAPAVRPSTVQAEIAVTPLARSEPVDFNADILPFLKSNCLACHSESEAEGDLILESAADLRRGGANGPAVVAGDSTTSYLLQVAAHQVDPIMPPEENDVGAINLTPDELGLLKLWIDQGAKDGKADAASEIDFRALPKEIDPILAAAISSDGRLAVCNRGNRLYVYDIVSGAVIQQLVDPNLLLDDQPTGTAHLDLVQSVAIDSSGHWIASGGFRTVKLWHRQGPGQEKQIGLPEKPKALAVSPNDRHVAVSLESGPIPIVDLATGEVQQTLKSPVPVVAMSFESNDRLVACGADKTLQVWDVASQEHADTTVDSGARAIVTSTNRVITGHDDGKVRVWKITQDASPKEAEAGTAEAKGTVPAGNAAAERLDGERSDGHPRLTLERELPGHSGGVTSLVGVPSRPNQVTSGGKDGKVTTWNIETGEPIRTFDQGAPVLSLAIAPDLHRLLSTGQNRLARLWNDEDGKMIAEAQGDFRMADQVAAKERQLALAEAELASTKTSIAELEKQQKSRSEAATKAAEALPVAEKHLIEKKDAVAQAEATKKEADQEVTELTESLSKAANLTSTSESKRDVIGNVAESLNASFDATRTATPNRAEAVQGKLDEIEKLLSAFGDQQKNAVAEIVTKSTELKTAIEQQLEASKKKAADAAKKVSEAESGVKDAERKLEQAQLNDTQRQKDSERSKAELDAVNSKLATQQTWLTGVESELADAKKRRTDGVWRPVATQFSPDRTLLAIAVEQGSIYLYDPISGAAKERLDGHEGQTIAIEWIGNTLVSIGDDQQVKTWNTRPRWSLARAIGGATTPSPLADRVLALDFSSDGSRLVTGTGEPSRSGSITVWNVDDGTIVQTINDAHSDTVYAVEFSPDDQSIASSAADRMAKIFQVSDGSFQRSFEGHTHHVLDVAWQANGKSIATAGADNVIKIWNAATGEQRRTIAGISKEVTSVSFSGISANTVSSSGDTNIRIHKSSDGGVVRTMNGGGDFVYTTSVSEDGKRIVSGGVQGILHVWNADDGQLLQSLEPAD